MSMMRIRESFASQVPVGIHMALVDKAKDPIGSIQMRKYGGRSFER